MAILEQQHASNPLLADPEEAYPTLSPWRNSYL